MKNPFIGFILGLLCVATVSAHDFWLEADRYTAPPGKEIAIDWRIGQGFLGETLVYLPFNAERVELWSAGGSRNLSPRFAGKPAIKVPAPDSGTAIVVTVSPKFDLSYDTWGEFRDFVDHERIPFSLPTANAGSVDEQYQRFAKILLSAEGALWQDQRLGLRYEWVIRRTSDQSLSAQLFFDAAPAVDHSVKVYRKGPQQSAETVEPVFYRTDEQGRVRISDLSSAERVLFNAVHLEREPAKPSPWQSYWASTSLQMP